MTKQTIVKLSFQPINTPFSQPLPPQLPHNTPPPLTPRWPLALPPPLANCRPFSLNVVTAFDAACSAAPTPPLTGPLLQRWARRASPQRRPRFGELKRRQMTFLVYIWRTSIPSSTETGNAPVEDSEAVPQWQRTSASTTATVLWRS